MSHQKKSVDLIIEAKFIITVDAEKSVLEAHSLVIDQSKIVAILPWHECQQAYEGKETQRLHQHMITPGLINTHNHAAMTLFRGYADDMALMDWLNNFIWPAEKAWLQEQFVYDGTELAIAEMIRSGTTTFSDMYFFCDQVAKAMDKSKLRGQICAPLFDFPTPGGNSPDEYLEKGVALAQSFKGHEKIQVAFGPHAPYTVSNGPLAKAAALADEHDIRVQIHLHETADEVNMSKDAHGMSAIARLDQIGFFSERSQCVHITQLDDQDLKILADRKVHAVHCPESNLKLASGFSPVAKMLDAGMNVSLGTDGAASNNNMNLLEELHLAAILGKVVAQNPEKINAHTALEMATINGAKALGIDHVTGSLEVGKAADVIALSLAGPENWPLYNPVSHMVYSAQASQVSHSWVAGEAVMIDRELKTLDLQDLKARVDHWQNQLKESARKA